MRKTIINMIKATIFEKNINNNFQFELLFAMTYVNNNQPTKVLQNLNFIKFLFKTIINFYIFKYQVLLSIYFYIKINNHPNLTIHLKDLKKNLN